MTEHLPKVGAVVLTYNSSDDLTECLSGLITQKGVDLKLIVVDNASRPNERAQMEADFLAAVPEGCVLTTAEASPDRVSRLTAVFIRNEANAGYSAGNNIGARVAAAIGCNAVLIINPDVRIGDLDYVATLTKMMLSEPRTAVACSAIRNLSGAQENPMTEPSFVEELLWPVKMIASRLRRRRQAAPSLPNTRFQVDKVSGACFLIRSDFLMQVGFFDETVFLYCEESILMAQVRATGWHMMMDPEIEALHAHRSHAKGNAITRFQAWSDSRGRFHRTYGAHSELRQSLLAASRATILWIVRGRTLLTRLGSGLSRGATTR